MIQEIELKQKNIEKNSDLEPEFFRCVKYNKFQEHFYPHEEFVFQNHINMYYNYPSNRLKFGFVPDNCFRNSKEISLKVYERFCFDEIDNVFILGTLENTKCQDLMLLPSYDQCKCLFGSLPVNSEIVEELSVSKLSGKLSRFNNNYERKIEIQAQYVSYMLKRTKNQVKIVPILIGKLSNDKLYELARLLQKYINDKRNVFIFPCSLLRVECNDFNMSHEIFKTKIRESFELKSEEVLEKLGLIRPKEFEKSCLTSGLEVGDFDLLMLAIIAIRMNTIEFCLNAISLSEQGKTNDQKSDNISPGSSKRSNSKKRDKSARKRSGSDRKRSASPGKRSKSPKKSTSSKSDSKSKSSKSQEVKIIIDECSPILGIDFVRTHDELKRFEVFKDGNSFISYFGACIEMIRTELTQCPPVLNETFKKIGPL